MSTIAVLPGLHAHRSGALWIPETHTALIADVHLGYGWAQRRRGELGPLVDSYTQQKLFRLNEELRPKRFVFLGDLVHAPRPCPPEREWIEGVLNSLASRAELISVRGNHDRKFAREFGHLPIQTVEFWSEGNIVAIHGDKFNPVPEHEILIAGHLHPALGLTDAAGAGRKILLFLVSTCCVVLPAFSPFAGGYNVIGGLPEELGSFFGAEPICAYAATSKRVVALGPLEHAIQQIFEMDAGSAAHFRRTRAASK